MAPPPQPPPPPPTADQVTSTLPDGSASNVQADLSSARTDIDDIRSRLNPRATPRATDPNLTAAIETEAVPAANPTTGPQRLTFVVPYHATTMSLGKGEGTRIAEDGITGRTNFHIHWHVKEQSKTVVTLGGPTSAVEIPNAHGDNLVRSINGYMMLTLGDAWHEAVGQHYLLSKEHDITLRTMTGPKVRLQADAGVVEAIGAEQVLLGSKKNVTIGADASASITDAGYQKHWGSDEAEFYDAATQKKWMAWADIAKAAYGLLMVFPSLIKEGKEGETGFKEERSIGKVKTLVDFAKFVSSVSRAKWKAHEGVVDITGSKNVGIVAGLAASMYGSLSSSITSAVSTTVLGGLSASVTGIGFTSVWGGKETSVKALIDAGIEGERGKVKVKGKKQGNFTVSDGPLIMTSDKAAQLNSNSGPVHIHGKTAVVCVAGPGTGHGFVASDTKILIGHVTGNADKFKSTNFDDNKRILIDKKSMVLKYDDAAVQLKDGEVRIESRGKTAAVQFTKGGKVTCEASKIELG